MAPVQSAAGLDNKSTKRLSPLASRTSEMGWGPDWNLDEVPVSEGLSGKHQSIALAGK